MSVRGAGLLDETSGANEVEVLSSSRAKILVSRLAVVVGVLLIVGALIAVRFFVHVDNKTEWALLCTPTNNSVTHSPSVSPSSLYTNVTLAPCNETITVHLPPTVWVAYADI